jgi:hypothetical protein
MLSLNEPAPYADDTRSVAMCVDETLRLVESVAQDVIERRLGSQPEEQEPQPTPSIVFRE